MLIKFTFVLKLIIFYLINCINIFINFYLEFLLIWGAGTENGQ